MFEFSGIRSTQLDFDEKLIGQKARDTKKTVSATLFFTWVGSKKEFAEKLRDPVMQDSTVSRVYQLPTPKTELKLARKHPSSPNRIHS